MEEMGVHNMLGLCVWHRYGISDRFKLGCLRGTTIYIFANLQVMSVRILSNALLYQIAINQSSTCGVTPV
eukprot:5258722-Pleurochrysis_carterae.AAC.1